MENFLLSGADKRTSFHICAGEYRGTDDLTALCSYAAARVTREREEKAYRFYITDALFALVNRDMRLTKPYRELVNPAQAEKEEDPQEIIDRMMKKLKGGKAD